MKIAVFSVLVLCFSLVFTGCKRKNVESNNTFEVSKLKQSFLASFQKTDVEFHEAYAELRVAATTFNSVPSVLDFNRFKEKWIAVRGPFHRLQMLKRMQGGIANPIDYDESRVETGRIDPSYIDYTDADPMGIITDVVTYPDIQGTNMLIWHETGTQNKTLGFQVLEFLLWGEDNNPTGAGTRNSGDYTLGNNINDRRRAFLSFTMFYLDLEMNLEFYNQSFEDAVLLADNEVFLEFLLSGIVRFIEQDIVDRGLSQAFNSMDPNDELSVFSEYTLEELEEMMAALDMLFVGRNDFTEHNNMFLLDFIRFVQPEMGATITQNYETAQASILAINGLFDVAINDPVERPKVKKAIDDLTILASNLRLFATDYGLNI